MQHSNTAGCILLKFYIKPQHTANVYNLLYVVSYRNSTSNHNMSHWRATSQGVVSYRNSTSNHNFAVYSVTLLWVVSYRNSTSNHNFTPRVDYSQGVVSYRNSTSNHNSLVPRLNVRIVVSYRNSTSNHNSPWHAKLTTKLYLIEILHQTTTLSRSEVNTHKLYLIEILHQTTTASTVNPMRSRCILSKFYIKPQHGRTCFGYNRVVSYRNSTSNHNISTLRSGSIMLYLIEILHQTTTSSMP